MSEKKSGWWATYLSDLETSERLRIEFMFLLGVFMFVLFEIWYNWLGVTASSAVDFMIVELSGGLLDRPWSVIAAKYGYLLAGTCYYLKVRTFGFLAMELPLLYLFFSQPRISGIFITDFPTMRDDSHVMVLDGKLDEVKGRSIYDDFGRKYRLPSARGGYALGRGEMKLIMSGIYAAMAVWMFCLPIYNPNETYRGRHDNGPEMDVLSVFLFSIWLVTFAPDLVVTLKRKFKRSERP